ncbi:sigma-70 family RNA polymerase sigma factor [Fulvivirgaceae bacterium BMA10]|uniref:Sigma-70 family RNA polymerase sigma factor n=1 Tax=Splendidivirga corallicola TaxID=3051826 RepID=A0ABT8KLJ4_9BACT|nr:sigma-70 family RNA polymerase sigma factor [Fulvivirgaceae bacterium BMA10]
MRLAIHKSISEERLIKGCLNNESKAQRTLYEKFSPKMFAICLRYVSDHSQAEDIMINGFMKVFNKISQYSGEGSFEGWIRRIMVNESLAFIRKNKNMYLEVDIEAANFQPDYGLLQNNLEAEDLMKLVKDLPMGYKTVFNLYAIEGYSHKEIAAMLNISENTSKSQLSRARNLLQHKLLESQKILTKNTLSYE